MVIKIFSHLVTRHGYQIGLLWSVMVYGVTLKNNLSRNQTQEVQLCQSHQRINGPQVKLKLDFFKQERKKNKGKKERKGKSIKDKEGGINHAEKIEIMDFFK